MSQKFYNASCILAENQLNLMYVVEFFMMCKLENFYQMAKKSQGYLGVVLRGLPSFNDYMD